MATNLAYPRNITEEGRWRTAPFSIRQMDELSVTPQRVISAELMSPLWVAEFTSVPMGRSEALALHAQLAAMRNSQRTFYVNVIEQVIPDKVVDAVVTFQSGWSSGFSSGFGRIVSSEPASDSPYSSGFNRGFAGIQAVSSPTVVAETTIVEPDFSGVTVHSIAGDNERIRLTGLPSEYTLKAGTFLSIVTDVGVELLQMVQEATTDVDGLTPFTDITPFIRPSVEVGNEVVIHKPYMRARMVPGSLTKEIDPNNFMFRVSFQAMQDI